MQLVKIFVAVLFAPAMVKATTEVAMNTPPTSASSLAQLIIPADQPLPPARRLVVLTPDWDLNEAELARRIWMLASPRCLTVLYFGLTHDSGTEARARRRLATLAALTRDDGVAVQTRLDLGTHWIPAVAAGQRPGDLVVCHAEQWVKGGLAGLGRRPLAHALASQLQTPVYLCSGFYPVLPENTTHWSAPILSWVVPLAILIGFFLLQVQIAQQVTGWLQTTLLSASVALEFGLVGLWNFFSA